MGPRISLEVSERRKISLPTLYSMVDSHGVSNTMSIFITQRDTLGKRNAIVLL
jgi:hypothetical protein